VFRLFALLAAIALLVLPGYWLLDITVPVQAFRARDVTDYVFFAEAAAVIYGGVVLGVAAYLLWARYAGSPVRPGGIFQGGTAGVASAALAVVLASGIYGQVALGSFERGIGTLWGMVVIFAVVLGAIVAAGLALLWMALRRPPKSRPMRPPPWGGPSGAGPLPD
jgi:hypothetical protein